MLGVKLRFALTVLESTARLRSSFSIPACTRAEQFSRLTRLTGTMGL